MLKFKKILSSVMIAVIILAHTSAIFAYTGDLDSNSKITLPETILNGQGVVSISKSISIYKLYYQWVEINNSTYKQAKQLKDELAVINYYKIYSTTNLAADYQKYSSAYSSYQQTYGTTVSDTSDARVQTIQSSIKALLPNYTSTWISTTNNAVTIDLSTFSGNKDYVLWVQLEEATGTKTYDADVYELTGTQQNSSNTNNNSNTDNNNNSGNNSNNNNNNNTDNNNNNTNDTTNTTKKLDPNGEITFSETITNGQGVVSISRSVSSYKLAYQWVEINNDLYKQIKQLKDELQVIKYYMIYSSTQLTSDYEKYYTAEINYKNLYGAYTEQKTAARVEAIDAKIEELLPAYTSAWTSTTNNAFTMDLSTFSGNKDYVVWVQLQKDDETYIYDAEIYELTGTQGNTNNNNNNNNSNNTSGKLDPNDDITIYDTLTNGQGVIGVSKNISTYKLYYQWVEIDNDLYKQIKQLKDELKVIINYKTYLSTNLDADYVKYTSSLSAYKSAYGTSVEDTSDTRVQTIKTKIEELLPAYTGVWQRTTNNAFSIDLSTFSGSKDYVLWVQLEKEDGTYIYDAEIFEIKGTKQDSSTGRTRKLDPNDEITIYDTLTNGQGVISVSRNISIYKLYYQWVEIDNDLYKQIRQLKDELKVITNYQVYLATNLSSDYDTYTSSLENYKTKYGTTIEDMTSARVEAIYLKIEELLPEYAGVWQRTTNNAFYMDLTSFSGVKDYVLWAQLEKEDGTYIYDAEIFEITGTKSNNTEPENNNNTVENTTNTVENTTNTTNTVENITNTTNTVENITNTTNNVDNTTTTPKTDNGNTSSTSTTPKTDGTTTSSSLPYTGVVSKVSLLGIIVTLVVTVMSYIKYRRVM